MGTDWLYEHFINGTEPKGIFPRLYYKLWKAVGVSPCGLFEYKIRKGMEKASDK